MRESRAVYSQTCGLNMKHDSCLWIDGCLIFAFHMQVSVQHLYVKYVLLFEMHEREYKPLLPIK